MLTDAMKEKITGHAKNSPMPGTTARPPVEGMPLHIDGDFAAYNCAGNDETTPDNARDRVLYRINRGCEVSGATRPFMHLSSRDCDKGMRFAVSDIPTCKPYQGQRNTGRKPMNWEHLRCWLETYEGPLFTTRQWQDREADDGMAYVGEASYEIGRPAAIMTKDKDMRMFAGLHIVWDTYEMVEVKPGTYDLVHGEKQYGHKFFWMQMVMGDQADNIIGIPKAGEVAAIKLLAGSQNNQHAFDAVWDFYRHKMKDDAADHFVAQAALLWMRTDKRAYLTNFLSIPGVEWPTDIKRAAARMVQRVLL